eukprot:jgi/Botrbrau1/4361/Bobra.105_2s0009.1
MSWIGDLYDGHPFLIGANIPWKSYGYDFADGVYDDEWWRGQKTESDGRPSGFKRLADAGANVARMWVFADAGSLMWDSNGFPYLGRNEITNIKAMLDAAGSFNIKVIPSFLDFLIGRTGSPRLAIITNWDVMTAYINHVVRPLVMACRGDRRLLAWEVINEPEQLFPAENNSFLTSVPMWQVQRFVARVAAAIHNTDPQALVTVGGNNLKYQYTKRADDPYDFRQFVYADAELAEAAQGDPLVQYGMSFIDIIQVHFYGEWSNDFCQDPTYEGDPSKASTSWTRSSKYNTLPVRGDDPGFANKPVLLSEVQPNIVGEPDHTATAMAERAVKQGYSGMLYWSAFTQYTSADGKGDTKGSWADMMPAIEKVAGSKISRTSK